MNNKKLTKEESKEKVKKLSEEEKKIVESATNNILSFLKEKNVDYSSFEDELNNIICNSINLSLLISKIFITLL